MERLPLELASMIISLLGVDSRRNFAWAFPSLRDEVQRIDKNALHVTKNEKTEVEQNGLVMYENEMIETWILQGKVEKIITHHRYYTSRIIYINREGKLHKDKGTGPALIYYDYENGNRRLINVIWFKNGVKHRNEKFGPAEIAWQLNGALDSKTWYKDGVIHRGNNEPAIQKYFYTGGLYKQYWYENGKKIKTERNKRISDGEGEIYKVITTVYQ